MEQQKAVELALKGYNIFLTGPAGSGKTYTLNKIISALKQQGKNIAITASTGIASTHLNGRTIHSWSGGGYLKLPEGDMERIARNDLLHTIENKEKVCERINDTQVLIIDEISMLPHYSFDLISDICEYIRMGENAGAFGGIQVIVCGDFFQLPPVNKKGERFADYCFNSNAWKTADFKVCYLDKIYRQSDPAFIDILNAIRTNSITKEHRKILDSLSTNFKNRENAINLYPHNEDVNKINDFQLSLIPETCFSNQMIQYKVTDDMDRIMITREIQEMADKGLDDLLKNVLAPQNLRLKKGAKAMILINNFVDDGESEASYVNGTLCRVVDLSEIHKGTIQLQRIKDGRMITLRPNKWMVEDNNEIIASVIQYPIKLAWAVTIHKSQGATYDFINVNLSHCFSVGMGYVGLSRAVTLDGIWLSGYNEMALKVNHKVIDIDLIFQSESKKNEAL